MALLWTLLDAITQSQLRLLPRHDPNARQKLKQLAREQQRQIKLLQTSTSGWSGTVTLPWAIAAGRSKSIQLAERAQTYPEVVDAVRGLIVRCVETLGPMVIAVDELDKITSAERAQSFVNEIKGIFGIPGCLYIVSISEDALITFERTALGVRDAFDSAFDEIVRIDYLSLADSLELLRSRVIGIAEPFGWLCHCLSGGLPRELVRLLRRVAEYRRTEPPLTLAGLCDVLVGEDLAIRAREFRIMAGRLAVRAPTNALMYLSNNASAKELLAATTQLVRQRVTDPDRAADQLRLETAMLAYHSATLKEVFTDELDQARARDARVDNHLPATFNQLGRARTAITEDPRLAWLLLDEFREAWQLGIVDGRLS